MNSTIRSKPQVPPNRVGKHVSIVDPPSPDAQRPQSVRESAEGTSSTQRANGLQVVAAIQAGLAAFMLIDIYPDLVAASGLMIEKVFALVPASVLLVIAAGLWGKTPWGWWTASSMYYFIALQGLATLLQGMTGVAEVNFGLGGVMVGIALSAIVVLNRGATLEAVAFTDATPRLFCSRVSPAMAGFLFSLAIFVPEIIGR